MAGFSAIASSIPPGAQFELLTAASGTWTHPEPGVSYNVLAILLGGGGGGGPSGGAGGTTSLAALASAAGGSGGGSSAGGAGGIGGISTTSNSGTLGSDLPYWGNGAFSGNAAFGLGGDPGLFFPWSVGYGRGGIGAGNGVSGGGGGSGRITVYKGTVTASQSYVCGAAGAAGTGAVAGNAGCIGLFYWKVR